MSVQNRFLLLFGILFLVEFYVYQAFKNLVSNSWLRFGYWAITILIYGFTLYQMLTFNRASRDHHQVQLLLSLVMIFMLPKLIALVFLLVGDISRVFEYGFKYFKLDTQKLLENDLKNVLDYQGALICEIILDENEKMEPKLSSEIKPNGKIISKPLEDMFPFLEREEFKRNMIIKIIQED